MAYEVAFSLPVHGDLSKDQLELLVSELGMYTQVYPKQEPTIPYAMGELDPYAGLFLLRGKTEGEWTLQCRTCRPPPPDSLREWRLRAEWVVGQLDRDAVAH